MTIPPPSWTNIAHRHGVKMLATLIFEQWGSVKEIGKEACVMLAGKIPDQRDWDLEGLEDRSNQFYAT